MSNPTGLEKIRTWIAAVRSVTANAVDAKDRALGVAVLRDLAITELARAVTALEEAVSVIDGECLPGEIDASFERLLDILNGKREEPGDGKG